MRALFLTVALLAFGPVAFACDVCGCSIGGNYFGILPQFQQPVSQDLGGGKIQSNTRWMATLNYIF